MHQDPLTQSFGTAFYIIAGGFALALIVWLAILIYALARASREQYPWDGKIRKRR